MNTFRKLTASVLMALSILLVSSSAQAWSITPTNQTDIDLKNYYDSLYGGTDKIVTTNYYNDTEHLTFVRVVQASTGIIKNWYFYSNKTKIGYSYIKNYLFEFKLMCPDGHSATVKRHIEIAKSIWTPNKYNPSDVTGGVCGYVAPPNQTDISEIEALYNDNYTVTRLISNRDIFKVTCTTYPFCYMSDGLGNYQYSWGVTYFSNTQKIAHRSNLMSWSFIAVRTKDTVTDQTAKDDIDMLTGLGFDGTSWVWVDYSWEEKWRTWFN